MITLASCGLIGNKPTAEITETDVKDTPVIEEKPVIKPDDNEKKEEEEEIVVDRPDDPPFVKTLRTGVFGYEYQTVSEDGTTTETMTIVYSDGTHLVYGPLWPTGEVPMRQILDYEKNEICVVSYHLKQYSIVPDAADVLFSTYGIPDYRAGIEQTGHGTADCNGEMLDYIDYISGGVEIRFFIKDGDVYARRHPEVDTFVFILTNTYSAPPTAEYFVIPDNYVEYEYQTPPRS